MLRKRLLTILFISLLLPVLVILFQSFAAIMDQRDQMTEMSGRYVRNLATYAADRWSEGIPGRVDAFLSLVADHGYEQLIADYAPDASQGERGKFIPGLVAYVTLSGRMMYHSRNAGILGQIFAKALADTGGRIVGSDGYIVGSFVSDVEDISYVAYISPTSSPAVYAVAAVTMLSWMGRNDFEMTKLAAAAAIGMLICLIALILLRGSVIAPLRSLASIVDGISWGAERVPLEKPSVGDIGVEEITSLRGAISALSQRMIEKKELEDRYLSDMVKAQEDERGRIAQDIHDGPIQVVSALIQKIQIASLPGAEIGEDPRRELAAAEAIADDLVQDLRAICDSLVPPWVSLGLASCIEEAASRFERQHSISIATNIDDDAKLPPETTLAIFRIFQEAVSNAVRHGGASEVRIDASIVGGMLRMTIEDDGEGFDASSRSSEDLMRAGCRGLNGMRQRAEALGGSCMIASTVGSGTKITVEVPAPKK